jgi:TonB family protein
LTSGLRIGEAVKLDVADLELPDLRRVGHFRDGFFIAVLLSISGCFGCSSSPTTPSRPATMTVYEAGTIGISLPTVIREVRPSYTSEAIANRIQGSVLLTAVVLPDGTVGEVMVVRSLDTTFGLDAQAVLAVKQWLFNPAMKDGVAVAVRVTIEMTFTLR